MCVVILTIVILWEKVQQQSCVSPVINGCFTAPCPESHTHHPRPWFRPIILREKIPILIILTCYQYQLPIYLAFSYVGVGICFEGGVVLYSLYIH